MFYNMPNIPNFNPVFNDINYIKGYEKHCLKKKSNGLGFFVFTYFMSMTASAFIIYLITMMISKNLSVISDKTFGYLMQIFVAVIASFFPSILYLIITKSDINETIMCKHVKLSLLFPIVFIGMAVAMFANSASEIVIQNFSLFGIENHIDFNNSSNSLLNNILYIISTALVPAFAEEFAFRGILMGSLRKYGDGFAIIVSSVMFGAMHGNIVQIPFAFILGLIFGYVVCKTNSIFPSIIIHFVNNFYAVVMDILQNEKILSKEAFYMIYYLVIVLFCLLGLISLIYLMKKNKGFFKLSDKNEPNNQLAKNLSFKEKNKAFFLTPGVILSLSFFLLETIFYIFAL